jgi:pantetheine-phosphate adenylyltransferase
VRPRGAAVFAKIVRIIPESETGLPSKSRGVIAIYPGSFDPITNGHLDLIQRGSRLFDRLIVSVLRNESKAPLFSAAERMEMLREVLQVYPNVEVDSFDGLLVEYAAGRSATVVLRGIRAISDYEYELQMALMNRRLRPQLETVFLLANEAYSFISSRLVKQVFGLGGNISGLVPASVEARMQRRMSKRKMSKRKRKGI